MFFLFHGAEYSLRNPEFFPLVFIFAAGAVIAGLWITAREIRARRGRIGGIFWMCFRWCILLPLVAAAFGLLLMGPQRIVGDILQYAMRGKIVLLIDRSPSTGATDVPDGVLLGRGVLPTRLRFCTESLVEALRSVHGPEVMLVAFTEATTFRTGNWMRIGPDTEAQFAGILLSLQPTGIGAGTNPIRALSEATEELGNDPDIMIFCSDGETEYNSDEILGWARAFYKREQKHIPIYTLGAGTPHRPSPIPKVGLDGKPSGEYVLSPYDNSVVFTKFNGELLDDIAKEAGGEYRHLERLIDARDLLRSAFLRSFRGGNQQGVRVENPEDLTFPLLVTTLILLLFLTKGLAWLKAIGSFFRGT